MSRKYAIDIDRLIFNLLYQKDDGHLLSYSQLHKTIKTVRKKLSHDTFNTHLTQLQCSGLVDKTHRGYYLTYKAKYLYQLKILELNRPNNTFLEAQNPELEQRLKMCFILSFHARKNSSWYRLQSKEQFEEFLLKYNLRLNDLQIWEEKDIESVKTHRDVKAFSPDPVYGITIRIVEETSRDHINMTYYYSLPGFSVPEVIDRKDQLEFRYVVLSRSLVQAEIDLWLENGLLAKIGVYDSEVRYRFCDRQFQMALSGCWDFFEDLWGFLLFKICRYIRNPKNEEKRWLEFFFGRECNGPIEQTLQDLRHNRKTHRRKKKEIDNIRSSIPLIHQEFEELTDSLATTKGQYLIHKLLEYIYPDFMRQNLSRAIIV